MTKKFWNLEQFFSLFPVHTYLIDVHGKYQSCNELQAKDFGLSSVKDIVGKTNYELPALKEHPDIIELLEANNKKVLTEKVPFAFYEPGYIQGLVTHFKSYKIPLFQKNKLMGLIGISFDLSNEAQRIDSLEQKIDQTQVAFSHIIDNLPEHIYWLDKDNRFLGCNATQAKDFGLKNSNEVVGLHISNFQTGENAVKLIANNNKILEEGISLSVEESFRNKNGENLLYLSKKVPLRNNRNKIIGLVGISIDITEQKKLEQTLREAKEAAEAGNIAKTEFLANMRHDIRTPLSGIVGFAELIKAESNEPHIKEYTENLVASSHALLELLDEVLEAVRVSSGEIPILRKKFDLHEAFKQITALYLAKAHQKKLKLKLEIAPDLPRYIIGDKIRVHRIILELVGNALNFTDHGSVLLQAQLAKIKDRKIVLRIIVSDTGIGMVKERQDEIYVQFKRLTPSYQGIYKGIGLGLYVVKQFIDELDGEIYVESELHKGTSFTCLIPLRLPLLDDESGIDKVQEEQSTSRVQPTTDDKANKPRILIVEDNAIAQLAAKGILTSMNCQVDIANNSKEALRLFLTNSYHLVFMDISLGEGMNGYEVTNLIRKDEGLERYTPIVALTSHGGEENRQRCIESGMDAVLTKPLTQAQATNIIKAFIPEVVWAEQQPDSK
jgi:two-component system aerobic respiration control sensor histidine kinase ArcB